MKPFLVFVFELFCVVLLSRAQAQESTTVKSGTRATSKAPVFSARFDSSYFDLQGHRPADSQIYDFGKIHYALQVMELSYLPSSTWQVSLAARHQLNFAETRYYQFHSYDQTQGMTDTKLKATKTFLTSSGLYLLNLGLSLPTGAIDKKNKYNQAYNYPYNMQLGSGTFDFEPSLIYLKPMGRHQVGAMGMAILRTGRNNYDYRRGNEYITKTWYSFSLKKYFTPGIWLNYHHVQRLTGADRTYGRIPPMEFYHTPRHFWELALNVNSQWPLTNNLNLNALIARPLWQESKNIDNVQVYIQWFAQLGVEGRF